MPRWGEHAVRHVREKGVPARGMAACSVPAWRAAGPRRPRGPSGAGSFTIRWRGWRAWRGWGARCRLRGAAWREGRARRGRSGGMRLGGRRLLRGKLRLRGGCRLVRHGWGGHRRWLSRGIRWRAPDARFDHEAAALADEQQVLDAITAHEGQIAVAIHGDLFQDGEAAPLTRSHPVATQCDDDDDQHQRHQRQQAENEWQPSLHVSPRWSIFRNPRAMVASFSSSCILCAA